MTLTLITAGLGLGFLIGCCYEACRRGGTLDLERQLDTAHRELLRTVGSNVRLLPSQRRRTVGQ